MMAQYLVLVVPLATIFHCTMKRLDCEQLAKSIDSIVSIVESISRATGWNGFDDDSLQKYTKIGSCMGLTSIIYS